MTAVLNAEDGSSLNGSIVSVSHLLVEKVLPWSMVYDREFDPDDQPGVACAAQLPDHELPARCGELDTCPLSAVTQRQRTDAGQPELSRERGRLSSALLGPPAHPRTAGEPGRDGTVRDDQRLRPHPRRASVSTTTCNWSIPTSPN